VVSYLASSNVAQLALVYSSSSLFYIFITMHMSPIAVDNDRYSALSNRWMDGWIDR
jgi:hypothetical protein